MSVVIPAHDEEAVIARCLERIARGADPGELDVVVVCNGCRDRTAAAARAVLPSATVIEVARASKSNALNVGDEHARGFPRVYLDADIEVAIEALRATATALEQPGVLCAAPTPRFDLSGRPRPVRHYYDIWQRLPYLTTDMVGTGVYALSARGRERFDRFPDLTADDQFVLQQFAARERRALADEHFLVHPPATLGGLVAIRRRAYRGTNELAASGLVRVPATGGAGRALLRLASSPRRWPPLATYVGVSVYAKLLARRARDVRWERDESARNLARAS